MNRNDAPMAEFFRFETPNRNFSAVCFRSIFPNRRGVAVRKNLTVPNGNFRAVTAFTALFFGFYTISRTRAYRKVVKNPYKNAVNAVLSYGQGVI